MFSTGTRALLVTMTLRQARRRTNLTSSSKYDFSTLKVTRHSANVLQVALNRPRKLNAMNKKFLSEMSSCFDSIAEDEDCRAVVVTGEGRLFTAGLDLGDVAFIQDLTGGVAAGYDDELDEDDENDTRPDVSRKAFNIRKLLLKVEDSFTSIERCPKPVIAAIHGACIGGGVDLVSACDIRYCARDAFFQIKEVDIGLPADVGTPQRLPRIVGGDSLIRELCYTARKMDAEEARQCGLVSRIAEDQREVVAAALATAQVIAEKSPVAVQGTKHNLIYARDHSVSESLGYMAAWNSAMLQSEDVMKAVIAVALNRPQKLNAMNKKFLSEMSSCFDAIAKDEDCRAVVFAGEGCLFTAGLDLVDVTLIQDLTGDITASDDDELDEDDSSGRFPKDL